LESAAISSIGRISSISSPFNKVPRKICKKVLFRSICKHR
jgi:hypothetical protein